MREEGYDQLGFFELGVMYLFLGIGSLIATPIMHKLGHPKWCMIIGASCDALWILTSIIPSMKSIADTQEWYYSDGFIYILTAMTSSLDGFGSALLWVA